MRLVDRRWRCCIEKFRLPRHGDASLDVDFDDVGENFADKSDDEADDDDDGKTNKQAKNNRKIKTKKSKIKRDDFNYVSVEPAPSSSSPPPPPKPARRRKSKNNDNDDDESDDANDADVNNISDSDDDLLSENDNDDDNNENLYEVDDNALIAPLGLVVVVKSADQAIKFDASCVGRELMWRMGKRTAPRRCVIARMATVKDKNTDSKINYAVRFLDDNAIVPVWLNNRDYGVDWAFIEKAAATDKPLAQHHATKELLTADVAVVDDDDDNNNNIDEVISAAERARQAAAREQRSRRRMTRVAPKTAPTTTTVTVAAQLAHNGTQRHFQRGTLLD